jgi:hypothetical protein
VPVTTMLSEVATWAELEWLSASEMRARPIATKGTFVAIKTFLFNRAWQKYWMPDYYKIVMIAATVIF